LIFIYQLLINVTKDTFFYYQRILKKIVQMFSSLLIIISEHQILILEWFVEDHVTLKTGVMMINSALITGINYTWLYIFIGIICHCFFLYFWSNQCSLGETLSETVNT